MGNVFGQEVGVPILGVNPERYVCYLYLFPQMVGIREIHIRIEGGMNTRRMQEGCVLIGGVARLI